MTSKPWRRTAAAAILLPLAGLGLAGLLLLVASDADLGGSVVAFAMAATPLAALLGAFAGRWWPERPRLAGAVASVLGGLAGAQLAAMVRFYQGGASGFLSLAAAPYTREVLMVVGVLPGLAALGAVIAGRGWPRAGGVSVLAALLVGGLASPVVGLGLIGVTAAAAVLNPFVLWALVVATVAVASRLGGGRSPS